jgi:hypothetical protein
MSKKLQEILQEFVMRDPYQLDIFMLDRRELQTTLIERACCGVQSSNIAHVCIASITCIKHESQPAITTGDVLRRQGPKTFVIVKRSD